MQGYTLYYWPSFTGRVEPILLLLEDAGEAYDLVRDLSTVTGTDSDGVGVPAFACPVLRRGNFTLAQTTAILEYLGRQHGYMPRGGAEADANCLQLALNAADIWQEAYKARREPDEGAEYLRERLGLWLANLAAFFAKTSGPGPFFFGPEPTFADFAVLNALNILVYMFAAGPLFPPELLAWKAAMEARPGVAANLETTEPVLYDQVGVGQTVPTPEEIAAFHATKGAKL